MLHSLKTKNFKKLADREFTFSEGLNVITGDNGAGKSTLTQAIAFALYGVKAIPGKSEHLPTWGASDVEVQLEVNGYTIVRTLKNCRVTKDGKIEASGNSACSNFIEENITKLNHKDFKFINWSAQDETAALLTVGATQLQRDVERFSGVEFIDKIIKMADKDLSILVSKLDGREAVDIAPLEAALTEVSKEESWLKVAIKTETSSAEIWKESVKEKRNLVQTIRTNLRQSQSAKQQLSAAEASISAAEKEIATLSAEFQAVRQSQVNWTDSDAEGLGAAKAELAEARVNNRLLAEAEDEKSILEEKVFELEHLRDRDLDNDEKRFHAQEQLNIAEDALSQLMQRHDNYLNAASEAKSQINSGVCKECGRPLEGADIPFLQKKLHDAEIEAAAMEPSLAQARKLATELRERLSNIPANSGAAERLGRTTARISELTAKLSEGPYTPLDPLSDTVTALEDRKAKAERAAEAAARLEKQISRQKTLLDTANQEKAAAEAQLQASDWHTQDELASEETAMENLSADLHRSELKLKDLQSKLKDAQATLAAANETLINSVAYNTELETMNSERSLLEAFVKFVKSSRVTFLSTVWNQLLGSASAFVNEATEGWISAISRSEGFEFCEDGVYSPAEAASGAQRGFLGVALRIGLAESMGLGMGTLILDEPTAAMREEHATRLAGSLLGREQVLLITHRKSDQVSGATILEV